MPSCRGSAWSTSALNQIGNSCKVSPVSALKASMNKTLSIARIVTFVHLFVRGVSITLLYVWYYAQHAHHHACQLQRLSDLAARSGGFQDFFSLAMPRSLVLLHTSHARAFAAKASPNATLWAIALKQCGPIVNHSKCNNPSSRFNPTPFPCHCRPSSRPDCYPSSPAPLQDRPA